MNSSKSRSSKNKPTTSSTRKKRTTLCSTKSPNAASRSKRCLHITATLKINPEFFVTEVETFLWQDRHGEQHRPAEMATGYLFACLLLVFNATAPSWLRMPGRVYALRWSPRYRRAACVSILRELKNRTLTISQAEDLRAMRERASTYWPTYQELLV